MLVVAVESTQHECVAKDQFDQVPAQSVAHGRYSVSRKRPVVCPGVYVMTSCRKKIETALIAAAALAVVLMAISLFVIFAIDRFERWSRKHDG